MSEETSAEDAKRLQITIVPPTTQRGSTPTEHQLAKPVEKNISLVQQKEGGEGLEEDIESDNPEYAITKEKIRKLAREIVATRKRKLRQKGRGSASLSYQN